MKRLPHKWRQVLYLLIVAALVVFVWKQGLDPWRSLASRPFAFLAVMMLTTLSLFLQAHTFRLCLPPQAKSPPLAGLVHVWSAGGVTGLIAPLLAGIAMRTALLKSMGVSVRDSALATARQTLFNLEYSLLAAALVLLLFPWESVPELGAVLALVWVLTWAIRRALTRWRWPSLSRHQTVAIWLLDFPRGKLAIWLSGLPALMAANYYFAFSGFGIGLEIHEAVLLATVTVLMSVAVLVPNGLGVLEALWIGIARHKGLDLTDAVGLALLLRLGYLASASMLWATLALIKPYRAAER